VYDYGEPEVEKEQPGFQGPMGPLDEGTTQRFNDEFAKYLDSLDAGEPPPPDYGIQDMGITQDSWDSYAQHMRDMDARGELPSQWKPGADGNFTYTDDDGSTITIDDGGNIVSYTDAPVGMLPGETPAVKPPAVTPPAVTPPAVTPPAVTPPAVTPPAVTPPAVTPPAENKDSGVNLSSLLALLAGAGGGSQQSSAPVQDNSADVQLMEDIFGPTLALTAPKAKTKTAKAAQGGSVDELLQILRG
jgi:hypothetical protein